MSSEFLALVSFVLITSFTPGPNNITSASMGILHGYSKSLPYLLGITIGFGGIMLACGWVASSLLKWFPAVEGGLRIVGAMYILWLAYHTFKSSYAFDDRAQPLLGFANGVLLQLLNPKAIIYGLTLYSTFMSDLVTGPVLLLLSAVALAGVAFWATSTWALFGATIRTHLHRPRLALLLNLALSLLLVYTAVDLSGVLGLLI